MSVQFGSWWVLVGADGYHGWPSVFRIRCASSLFALHCRNALIALLSIIRTGYLLWAVRGLVDTDKGAVLA